MNIRKALKNTFIGFIVMVVVIAAMVGAIELVAFTFHAVGIALAIVTGLILAFIAVLIFVLLDQWDDNRNRYDR